MLKALGYIAIIAAIVFVVALIGWIVMYSWQPSQEPRQQQQADEPPTVQEKREHRESFWQRTTEDPIALYTLVLAIFTGMLSLVAVLQLILLVRAEYTSTMTAEAAQKSAEAAQKSAGIAEKTVTTMADTAERQLRAYVSPMFANISNFGTEGVIHSQVILKNTGQTPAYEVSTEFFVTAANFPLREPLPRPKLSEATRSTGSLGPGGEKFLNVDTSKPLNANDVAKIRQGTGAVYVYGDVEYTDAFGKKRYTRFRYYYGGNTGANPTGSLSVHREGNEAN